MFFLKSLADLFYPPICLTCSEHAFTDILCTRCTASLPHTYFASLRNNIIERIFSGRLDIKAAFSEFYFEKNKVIQSVLHQLKYRNNREAGLFLGRCIGKSILESPAFLEAGQLIPLPLHPKKEHKRGYNQALVICEGISSVTRQKVNKNAVVRNKFSDSQTKKHRTERWKNVDGIFSLKDKKSISSEKVILIDDVITTGATLEACGKELANEVSSLLIATAAYASK